MNGGGLLLSILVVVSQLPQFPAWGSGLTHINIKAGNAEERCRMVIFGRDGWLESAKLMEIQGNNTEVKVDRRTKRKIRSIRTDGIECCWSISSTRTKTVVNGRTMMTNKMIGDSKRLLARRKRDVDTLLRPFTTRAFRNLDNYAKIGQCP